MKKNINYSPNGAMRLEGIVSALQNSPVSRHITEIIIVADVADCVIDGFVPDASHPDGMYPVQEELPDTFDYVLLSVRRYRPTNFQAGISTIDTFEDVTGGYRE